MATHTRQIVEVACAIDTLARIDVLSRLSADALSALGVEAATVAKLQEQEAAFEAKLEADAEYNTDDELDDDTADLDTLKLEPEAAQRVDRAVTACLDTYKPHGAFRVFNPAICTLPPKYAEPAIKLIGTVMVFKGQDVYELLRRATHCALMSVTIGQENPAALPAGADDLNRALARACAEALVESAADHVNAEIVKIALEEGLYTGDRLCPGMGNFPTETRSQFMFYTQSEKRLGLKLDEDGTFDPPYSTVGVIGMYDPSQKNRRRACGRCKYRSFCTIRAIGMNCHGSRGTFKEA